MPASPERHKTQTPPRLTNYSAKAQAGWRRIQLLQQRLPLELQRRYHLRLHSFAIGCITLLTMWAASFAMMVAQIERLSLRYGIALLAGYGMYLLLLRAWANYLLQLENERDDSADAIDLLDASDEMLRAGQDAKDAVTDFYAPDVASGGGGDFAGGGASGDWGVGDAITNAAGDAIGGAAEALGGADEGAIVVIPVLAIFSAAFFALLGVGLLVLSFFSSEILLAITLEVAFSYASARIALQLAREGWLSAAVRLTWKPLLAAVITSVALGAALDHWLPQAHSLPHAVQLLKSR